MHSPLIFAALADATLVLHAALVVFFVLGALLILIGGKRGWRWIYSPLFRTLHLCGIAFVVVSTWLGMTCPLTTLENLLRTKSGQLAYDAGFIESWLHSLLFYQGPSWVFTLTYSIFGAIVVLGWKLYPPKRKQ